MTEEKSYRLICELKYKSKILSIPLKHYNITYMIVNKSHIRIQGIKQEIKVNGLDSLNTSLEPASAVSIKDNSNYYVNITAYKNKEKETLPLEEQKMISFDLGIKNQLTCSNGLIINYNIPKSKKEKRMQRQLSRKVKGSNNYYKQNKRLNIEQNKTVNRRQDTINKIVHYLSSNFDIVITQEDHISAWLRLWGRRIESTGIG